jgi:hypothetical protein
MCTLFYVSIQEFVLLKDFLAAGSNKVDQSYSLWKESDRTNSGGDTDDGNIENPFYDNTSVINSLDDPVSQFLETVPSSENGSAGDRAEMFLPGLVIHMVPQQRHISMPLWKGWRFQERVRNYKAYLANRDVFKDIVVSPSMFFDHLPWRYAHCIFVFKIFVPGKIEVYVLDQINTFQMSQCHEKGVGISK